MSDMDLTKLKKKLEAGIAPSPMEFEALILEVERCRRERDELYKTASQRWAVLQKYEGIDDELKKLESELERVKGENQELELAIEHWSDEAHKHRKENADLKESLLDQDRTREELQKQLADSEKKVEELEEKINPYDPLQDLT